MDALAAAGIESECATIWPEPKGQFVEHELRPYQQAALDSWEVAGHRGVVVLPTGAGKTRVALAALVRLKVSTLCRHAALRMIGHFERSAP